ncbi:NUDIX hydrolase [Hydrogenispora ethanolica]|uniref:NUDIX hydrolase n=1 Tax=Hydrogenispora ethanolica TaxID=1082276 RepID=UPI0014044C8C|nr:NUDIX domain-containing protein [Hydrogenispora ethanolica]
MVFVGDRLLILRRKNGVWLFPKGHIDPGETAAQAAVREVKEESGLTARILEKLAETAYNFTEDGREHYKTVEWFVMEALTEEIVPEADLFTAGQTITQTELDRLTFANDRELAVKAFQAIVRIQLKEKGADKT